jgi:hypothetical protein
LEGKFQNYAPQAIGCGGLLRRLRRACAKITGEKDALIHSFIFFGDAGECAALVRGTEAYAAEHG